MNNLIHESDGSEEDDEPNDITLAYMEPIVLHLTSDSCGQRLDKVLSEYLPAYSRSRLQQWIEAGHVTVNGSKARNKLTVLGYEEVIIYPQTLPSHAAYQPEKMFIDVIFEDDHVLVVNKPAGLVVHPAAGNWSGTLLNGLLAYCPALLHVPRAGIVHRLDKETSGLMVVAKTLEAQTDLVRQLQARTVMREYVAVVWGKPHLSGVIDAAIGRHMRDRIKMTVTDKQGAKPAITYFERMAIGQLDNKVVSLLVCRLQTGRTHQIRVHLAHVGCHIVGDPLYGKSHLAGYFPRQALHARRLAVIHPKTSEEMTWQVNLPEDIAGLLLKTGIAYSE